MELSASIHKRNLGTNKNADGHIDVDLRCGGNACRNLSFALQYGGGQGVVSPTEICKTESSCAEHGSTQHESEATLGHRNKLQEKRVGFRWTAQRIVNLHDVIETLRMQHLTFDSYTTVEQCELIFPLLENAGDLLPDILLRRLEEKPKKFKWTAERAAVLQDVVDSLQTQHPNFNNFTYEEQCELDFPLMKDVKDLQPDILLRRLEEKPKKFFWTAERAAVLQT